MSPVLQPGHEPAPGTRVRDTAALDATLERLSRRSRLSGILSLVGLLAVLAALVLSARQLAEMNGQVTALERERARLDGEIVSRRAELRTVTDSLARKSEAYQAYHQAVRQRMPVLAAAAAEAASSSAAATRVVYIQYRGALPRALANQLRERLNDSGYSAPAVEFIDRPFSNSVRFFHPENQEEATELARRTEAFFAEQGCPASFPAQDLSARGGSVPVGQMEIWVNLDCRGRASAEAPPAPGGSPRA